jgi:hypothetical protein
MSQSHLKFSENDKHQSIHNRALEIAGRYKKAEGELIEIIQVAEKNQVHVSRGHSSLFQYIVQDLGLPENLTYNLITVARKAIEIPEIKFQIQSGALNLSHARKIVPIIDSKNKTEWLQKAENLSLRQLEKAVVHLRPRLATPERASYVKNDHIKLEIGLSEQAMLDLRRAQDLLSQSKNRAVTLEETIGHLTHEFLKRTDPLEKAKRHVVRSPQTQKETPKNQTDLQKNEHQIDLTKENLNQSVRKLASKRVGDLNPGLDTQKPGMRESIPAHILHRVNLRDQRRCTFQHQDRRCKQTRWLHIHHIHPVHEGGPNTLENLTTLCSTHHKWIHSR